MFNLFSKKYSPQEKAFFKFLRLNALFLHLTDEELAIFLPYLHLRQYNQNEVIFFRNDPSQALYIIEKGAVSLNLDIQQKTEILFQAQSGFCFGESSILLSQQRLYNAVCMSESASIYVIPQINIQTIFEEYPTIKAKVSEAYADLLYQQLHAIFKTYRESLGFFELDHAFQRLKKENFKSNHFD